jgi:hypothetical protein
MFRLFGSIAKGGAFLVAALLTVSSAGAQSSALGHAVAPGYHPVYSAGASTLRVYPGDKGFHSTMQIEHYYQVLERGEPAVKPAYVAPVRQTAAPSVAVSYSESSSKPMMVDIRGPDGQVRSFPLAHGRDTIRVRTIIVHPGESLTLRFQGATVQAPKK